MIVRSWLCYPFSPHFTHLFSGEPPPTCCSSPCHFWKGLDPQTRNYPGQQVQRKISLYHAFGWVCADQIAIPLYPCEKSLLVWMQEGKILSLYIWFNLVEPGPAEQAGLTSHYVSFIKWQNGLFAFPIISICVAERIKSRTHCFLFVKWWHYIQ